MKRLLSTAVQVRKAPDEAERLAAILEGKELLTQLPTDSEVRDAMMRLARDLKDMVDARIAGGAGWEVSDMETNLTSTPEGEVVLRGTVMIRRDEPNA